MIGPVGDMLVLAETDPALDKALAVVALHLHQTIERLGLYKPGISKQSCVLCSLSVRDFLHRIGFKEARVAPVLCVVRAERDGKEIHSTGIGVPKAYPTTRARWNGHMVVTVRDVLIDTTLYQARRPQWPMLPGMMATPLGGFPVSKPPRMYGLDVLAATMTEPDFGEANPDKYFCSVTWLSNPTNNVWRNGPDARRDTRHPIVAALAAIHQRWPRLDR